MSLLFFFKTHEGPRAGAFEPIEVITARGEKPKKKHRRRVYEIESPGREGIAIESFERINTRRIEQERDDEDVILLLLNLGEL